MTEFIIAVHICFVKQPFLLLHPYWKNVVSINMERQIERNTSNTTAEQPDLRENEKGRKVLN